MVTIYQLKPKFQQLLKPLTQRLFNAGMTPNSITVSAIILSFLIGLSLWYNLLGRWTLLIVPIGLIIRMSLNALDGMMANIYHLKSKKGEILNELGDVLSDVFIFLPFIKIANTPTVLLFVGLAIFNEFCGVLTKAVSGNRRYDGPMGKSDRAFLGGLYCLLLFFYSSFEINSHLVFAGASALMMIGSLLRLKNSLK